jgi:hypothetical protein
VNPYCGSFSVKKEETITEFDSERYITTKSKEDIIVSGNGKPLLYELKPETVYWKNENENLILLGDIG